MAKVGRLGVMAWATTLIGCGDATSPSGIEDPRGIWRLAAIDPEPLPTLIGEGTVTSTGEHFKTLLTGIKLSIQSEENLIPGEPTVRLFVALRDSVFSPGGQFLRIEAIEEFSVVLGQGAWSMRGPNEIAFAFYCGDDGAESCGAFLTSGVVSDDTMTAGARLRIPGGQHVPRTLTFVYEGPVTCPTCSPPK